MPRDLPHHPAGRPAGGFSDRDSQAMQIQLDREHADHPLLRRVPALQFFCFPISNVIYTFVDRTSSRHVAYFLIGFLNNQIRELADEEMLHDVDVLFE